jgi:hypothetical protein
MKLINSYINKVTNIYFNKDIINNVIYKNYETYNCPLYNFLLKYIL